MLSKFCTVPKAKVAICPNLGWIPDFPDGGAMLNPTFNGEAIAPENNANTSELDVPAINAAMARADRLVDPEQRAQAWGEVDRMVTAQAPAIPWLWVKQDNIMSDDVQGVIGRWNATWDLSYTSLKR
jgi:peptide/nickel transport system substrate-binding protein